jgi:hypothetical protein
MIMRPNFSVLCGRVSLAIGISLCAGNIATGSAIAAEQVVFKYQALREAISVRELTDFATTGKASPKLEVYLKFSQNGARDLRQALANEVKVDRAQLDQLLNSWAGKLILDEISQIIRNGSGQASKQALRSALNLAIQDNKFNLIELFQNYPTAQVQVDLDRLIETSKRIEAQS